MTTITGAKTEQPAFNSTIEKTITRTHGRILHRNRDTLHKEIEHIFIDISVPWFDWSEQYELLTESRTKINYKDLTNLNYLEPGIGKPPMANPTIKENTPTYQKEREKQKWMERSPPGTQDEEHCKPYARTPKMHSTRLAISSYKMTKWATN